MNCQTSVLKPPEPAQSSCHAKRRSMSPSATPATPMECPCRQVQHLPRKEPRRHGHPPRSQASAISATPATRNEGRYRQAPRLARETKVNVAKCHACHAKCRGVTCDQGAPSAPPEPAQCQKCHACHANATSMSPSATPATQIESQVPRLPRKVPRRHLRPRGPKRTTTASPVPQVPRLHVAKCHACHVAKRHACHAQRRSISPSATPATRNKLMSPSAMPAMQSAAASPATKGPQARHQSQPSARSATPATQMLRPSPHLPRKWKVKCHACHAKCRGVTRARPVP